MPHKNVDYTKTVMYKFMCKDRSVKSTYIGHTTDFRTRKCAHKGNCNKIKSRKSNYKLYTTIREHGGWDNWDMIEIEKYPCKDGNEARQREQYWYDKHEDLLNSIRPYTSIETFKEQQKQYTIDNIEKKKQYDIENAEKIKEYQKQYNIENAEKKQKTDKQYYINNTEKIKEKNKQYYIDNTEKIKEKNKQYYIVNAENFKEQKKQYYIDNKEIIAERRKEKRKQIRELKKEAHTA